MKRIRPHIFIVGILLLLTACNFPGSSETPTQGPDAIYTEAALTVVAQQTQAALGTAIVVASPTSGGVPATPTLPMVIVPTATPLAPTNTPLPTNTLHCTSVCCSISLVFACHLGNRGSTLGWSKGRCPILIRRDPSIIMFYNQSRLLQTQLRSLSKPYWY